MALKESILENNMYDVVIVGGGPAGLSAGIYAMRAALNAVLVEKGMPGGQIALTQGTWRIIPASRRSAGSNFARSS